jgi:hypothetical protein
MDTDSVLTDNYKQMRYQPITIPHQALSSMSQVELIDVTNIYLTAQLTGKHLTVFTNNGLGGKMYK